MDNSDNNNPTVIRPRKPAAANKIGTPATAAPDDGATVIKKSGPGQARALTQFGKSICGHVGK